MFSNFWNKDDSLSERRIYDPVYIREAEEYKKEQEQEREREKQKHTVILTIKNKSFKNNSMTKYYPMICKNL